MPVRLLLLLTLAILTVPAQAQQKCGPEEGGPPSCEASGPASQSDPEADASAGNPVNLISGNKYQKEVDLPALPGILGLEIVRYYNSTLAGDHSPNGLLGRGWRLSYETELYVSARSLQILQADGRHLQFTRDKKVPNLCASPDPAQGSVRIERKGLDEEYIWSWPDGRQLHFDHDGHLQEIRAASGERLTLFRAPDGKLLHITDPQGRQLRLIYPDRSVAARNDHFNGIQAIESPVGRFEYHHDDTRERQALANLTAVEYPGAGGRRYHYEDSRFASYLTGITVTDGKTSTRLSRYAYDDSGLAIRSEHGQQSIRLTRQAGTVLVTDGAGRQTHFDYAIVAGQYRILEARGARCPGCGPANRRYGYDPLGRRQTQTRLNEQGHAQETIITRRDAQGRIATIERSAYLKGKAQPPQRLAEYRYQGEPLQTLTITRPSVVPGRDFITRLDYNAHGQITRIRQSGYSPRIDAEPQAITRATTYRYETVNGSSRLTQVDGPLPNGPKQTPEDSDVTVYRYDDAGVLQDVTLPLERHRKSGGTVIESLIAANALAPEMTSPRDISAGSLTPSLQPQRMEGTPSPQLAWQDAEGTVWLKAAYGLPGTAAARQMLVVESMRGTAYRLFDDFGRVVAVRNPQQSWQQAGYDTADRLIEITDPRGARQVIERDIAGRLQSLKRYEPGREQPESVITQHYEGERLVQESIQDADGTRLNAYTYDTNGRLEAETLTIVANGMLACLMPDVIHLRHRYRYDAQGRQIATELSDTQDQIVVRLHKGYDDSGRVTQLVSDGLLPAWLGGSTPIIKDIAWQSLQTEQGRINYATSLEHGNGIQEQWPIAPREKMKSPSTAEAIEVSSAEPTANDAAGLPQQLSRQSGHLHLHWNAAAQLDEVSRDGKVLAHYLYDARGRRVMKRVTGQAPVLFFYQGVQLIAEATAQGNITEAYGYLGYRPVAQLSLRGQGWIAALQQRLWGPEVHALQTSLAGRVTTMSDARARPLWQDGEPQPSAAQPLRYVGQYHDEETGLDYHGARYFDAGTGRFLSPDPRGIADAQSQVPAGHLLDLYLYAGNDPDHYFDPDGAAKIHYYAITTGSNGKSLGETQGFTNARWAFYIDDIKANPDDTSDLGKLQNQYAAVGKMLLIDANGDFEKPGHFNGADGTVSTAQKQIFIETSGTAATRVNDFKKHYADKLIELPNFTVDMEDDRATALIAYYAKDPALNGTCLIKKTILPEIKFSDEEEPINVTTAESGIAQEQRIVACGDQSANGVAERRIHKYNYAAMILESVSPQIYKDCSKNGCPGKNLQGTVLSGYVASYGMTQFVGMTMAETLLDMVDKEHDPDARKALKLDDSSLWTDKKGAMLVAMKGSNYVGKAFDAHNASTLDWSQAAKADRDAFLSGSGLTETQAEKLWNGINAWKKNPTKGLDEEAKNALMTETLFANSTVKDYLMGIFKDSKPDGAFDQVSLYLMRKSYNEVAASHIVDETNTEKKPEDGGEADAWTVRQREIETEFAARVARRHNGDSKKYKYATTGTLEEMMKYDSTQHNYAHRFINVDTWPWTPPQNPTKTPPVANYFSLRCTETLPAKTVPRHGLQITPLSLPSPEQS